MDWAQVLTFIWEQIILAFLPVLIGVVAFIWGIVWGIIQYKNQMNAQLFLEFTKRFEEIMQSFPENAWSVRTDLDDTLPEPSSELSLAALRYLNLCGEEYYLYTKKMLSKEVWEIWEAELKRTLQSPLFRREWEQLKSEFDAYQEFQKYVDEVMKL